MKISSYIIIVLKKILDIMSKSLKQIPKFIHNLFIPYCLHFLKPIFDLKLDNMKRSKNSMKICIGTFIYFQIISIFFSLIFFYKFGVEVFNNIV